MIMENGLKFGVTLCICEGRRKKKNVVLSPWMEKTKITCEWTILMDLIIVLFYCIEHIAFFFLVWDGWRA